MTSQSYPLLTAGSTPNPFLLPAKCATTIQAERWAKIAAKKAELNKANRKAKYRSRWERSATEVLMAAGAQYKQSRAMRQALNGGAA